MKNMAMLDDNGFVTNVVVCDDDVTETATLVTYDDNNPAYIGGDYHEGYFYPPQPYPSWSRNKGEWVAPVPYPTEEGRWVWNEDAQEWQA